MIQFLTREQREEVLDMERHNIWSMFVRLDPDWPHPCICRP